MDELQKIQAQIAELQQQAERLAAQKKAEVLEDVKAKIKAYGLTLKDLGLSDKSGAPRNFPPVAIKYRHGDLTWTGRGRQPKFIVDYINNGGSLDELAV